MFEASSRYSMEGSGSKEDEVEGRTPHNAKMQKKFQDKKLKPLTIEKSEIDVQLVKTDSGVFVENTNFLHGKGIVVNNKVLGAQTPDANGVEKSTFSSIVSQGSGFLKDLSRKNTSEDNKDEESKTNTQTGSKPITINIKGATNLKRVESSTESDASDSNVGGTPSNRGIVVFKTETQEADGEINLEDLKKLGALGAGSQGTVDKMLHVPSGRLIALKNVKLTTDENFIKALKIELNTLRDCKSEYIVKCFGAYSNQDGIIIALEYMDKGSLGDVIKSCGSLPEVIIGMITFQVLKGLEYLHKTIKVIHRDIKPSNLLLNSEGQVKIADFGVSGTIESTFECKHTWVGTLPYMSPERCKGEGYNFDTDLWSLGLTIVEMAIGKYPYQEAGEKSKLTFWDVLECISSKPVPKLPDNFTEDIKDFVAICLRKEVGTRSSATELLQHKFVKRYAKVGMSSFKSWLQYAD
jgi:hypothetical protein